MRQYLILILAPYFLFGKNIYYESGKEGWFYYQDPIHYQEDNRTQEDEALIASLPEDFTTMKAEDFKKLEEQVRDIAVMKPTFENITAWKRMVKFSTDQSKKFSVNWKLSSLIDDSYDNTEIGSGGFSNKNMKEFEKQKDLAKYITNDVVFVTIVKDGNSMLTRKQIVANMDLKRDFGIDTKIFSLEDFPEVEAQLGIKNDVENFVFYKDTKKWQRIRRGLIDAKSFVDDFMFYEKNKDAFDNAKNQKKDNQWQ